MANHFSQTADTSSAGPGYSAYRPSLYPANDLDPITISQMKMETHHHGKQTVIHVLVPPKRAVALVALVEDEQGSVTWLQLYNQPSETVVPAEEILRRGSCYLLKEPFLTSDPTASLRVDHPGDIMLLPREHKLVPARWRVTELVFGLSYDPTMLGNDAAGKKRWAEAERLYTTALQISRTFRDVQLAYQNRSLANLHLRRPDAALADAIESRGAYDPVTTEMGLLREAAALYELAKYDQCLDRLQTLRTACPGTTSATLMIDRVQARLQEQQTGRYDFQRMHKQAKATPALVDCATYGMPVEVRDSPGQGRGLFTTRNVVAGELLICEKAFEYACSGMHQLDSSQISSDAAPKDPAAGMNPYASLVEQTVQKLFHDFEAAVAFVGLCNRQFDAVPSFEVDGHPVINSFLVEEIISLTAFEGPRTSLSFLRVIVSDCTEKRENYTSNGIWSLISHIKHSCISNVRRSFIGDMQIVRATRDLEDGSEILSGQLPDEFDSYNRAHKRPRSLCECALCLDIRATPANVLAQRKSLIEQYKKFMQTGKRTMKDIRSAQKTVQRLDDTYSSAAKSPGAVRLEVYSPYLTLSQWLMKFKKPYEAFEMTVKGLEALGFIISAGPSGGDPKSSEPELHIRQWGIANPFSVNAFLDLYRAYKTAAPQLAAAARMYAEVAYSMVMGEKETFLDTYHGIV